MVKDFATKLKTLRDDNNITQAELARRLNVSRACVNSWEMNLSNPSTESVIEIAKLFDVSTDYLLGMDEFSSLNVTGLAVSDVSTLYNLAKRFKRQK